MHSTELDQARTPPRLDFLWLELTNRCNLRCVHCYADSGPDAEVDNPLSTADYAELLRQAFDAGCTRVQFIGGEPTLHRDLPMLVECASAVGSVRDEQLGEIVLSDRLRDVRVSIGQAVGAASTSCDPDTIGCPPLNQCGPQINGARLDHASPHR